MCQPPTSKPQPPGPALPAGLCLALAAAILAVYWPALQCDFVNYDDPEYFTANKHVLGGWSLENLWWAFTTSHTGNWHPLTWLSLMLDVELFGPGATGPHLTSVMLHCANALLLFLGLRRLTRTTWPSLLVAALFALHPLRVESVAWVSERKDVLSVFFFLLSLLAYAAYAQARAQGHPGAAIPAAPPPGSGSARPALPPAAWYALCLGCFALGLMSKPMLVTMPFVLLLLDWWPLERFAQAQAPGTALRRLAWEKWPFFALSALSCGVTLVVQRYSMVSPDVISLGRRLENIFMSYARYLGKTLWPNRLTVAYTYPEHWDGWLVLYAVALVVGLCALAWLCVRRLPAVFTGWFWFVGTLLPVIGLVQVGDQSLADRYTYLPSMGLLLAAVWALRAGLAHQRLAGTVAGLLAVGGLAACGLQTRQQLGYWQNTGTLFRHALAVTGDNWSAYQNLGVWLADQGRSQEALDCFRRMFRMQPRLAEHYYNLGNACGRVGGWPEAIACYQHALAKVPGRVEVLNNLGFAFTFNQQPDEAIACFEAVLQQTPNSPGVHNNLAAVLLRQHRLAEAIQHYREAWRLNPNNASICVNLADALVKQGQRAEAAQLYQTALRLDPGNPQAPARLRALESPAAP